MLGGAMAWMALPGRLLLIGASMAGAAAAQAPAPAPTSAQPSLSPAAARFLADARWLADDARQGRGLGTAGLAEAGEWIAARFREAGLEPGGDAGGFLHRFEVPVGVRVGPGTAAAVDGRAVPAAEIFPIGFSAIAEAEGETVVAGFGITAPELGVDDYAGVAAKGRVVVVRRFAPAGGPFAAEEIASRYGDLRYKAWNAREHGAIGLVIVDLPVGQAGSDAGGGAEIGLPPDAVPPQLSVESAGGDAGIPAVVLSRAAGAALFEGGHRVRLAVDLVRRSLFTANVVGVLRAGAAERDASPMAPIAPTAPMGPVVLGAHYDHLGMGGPGSLAPLAREPHNGADDNASGVAALLEAARRLAARRAELRRDVVFVAFSGEESGLFGSTSLVRQPPAGLRLEAALAMINLDMVGRLRGKLSVLAGETALEWPGLVRPACRRAGLECTLSGEGYGPSDHAPFYAAGLPVLHLFTGFHDDYHRPTDDVERLDPEGGAKIAGLAADLAAELAGRSGRLTYHSAPVPLRLAGDLRSYGASLGTLVDTPPDGRPGVLIAELQPGGAAERAGLRRGDRLVELAGSAVRDTAALTSLMRKVRPGEKAPAVVERAGERLTVEVTFGGAGRSR
jgi:Peptidase family M28/PA domain/PDZ domain